MKKRIIILLLFFCLLAGCTPQTKNEIKAEDIAMTYEAKNKKGQKFLYELPFRTVSDKRVRKGSLALF